MDIQCFVLHDQKVLGPFNKENLSQRIAKGEFPQNSQVWWKGQKDWLSLTAFQNLAPEEAKVVKLGKQSNWYIEREGKVSGPYQKEELLNFLKQATSLANVRVWKKGEKHKATVYQYNDLSNALGIVQRKSTRAPIVGDAKIQVRGTNMDSKVCSISEGGIGLTHASSLMTGDKIEISIDSPLLNIPIHTTAIVKYIAPTGRVGAQFESLSSEALTSIIEYINQFKTPETKAA